MRTFLHQAIAEGFFHADLHQGNLFVLADGRIAAIDFGIMGRINRQALPVTFLGCFANP